MFNYISHKIDCYKLLALAKKQQNGKSERSDMKQWEYLLSRASFTPGGYYYSERVKSDFEHFLIQHRINPIGYGRFFMDDDTIEFSLRNNNKLKLIIEKYQGRIFD